MSKNKIIWRAVAIAVVIVFALLASYPPNTQVILEEKITEKHEHGQWIEGKREEIPKSVLRFVMKARETTTSVEREYEEGGAKYRVRRVKHLVPGKIKLGLDLRGGAELLYQVRVKPEDDRAGITAEVIGILEKRIDPQGILEYRIQQQGRRRILIQVPGATKEEIERLKERIVTMGMLEFRLCETDPAKRKRARDGKKVAGCYKHWVGLRKGELPDPDEPEPRWHLVKNQTELTGKYLSAVYPTYGEGMEPVVGFKMNARGSKIFSRLTERNQGSPLAIILDDKLVSAPNIKERISGSGVISGGFKQKEVNDLVATLRAGSLPADLDLRMENAVGPSLGSDSIRQGVRAIVVGSVIVLVFVAAYYLWAGAVADFALVLNLILVTAALSIFQATLTLPGIAGLVLTVGMAIDANVLIFERIREEKEKAGKTIKNAIATGYQRAFLTILDANLTTLITAVILYIVGTGPVRGFAVTLSCGIIFSMFTALFVTRTILEIGLYRGLVVDLRMRQIFPRPSISFLKHRKVAAIVSATVIAIGILTFLVRGKSNYDIDFTGGTLVQLRLDEAANVADVREGLADHGYGDTEVQSMWAAGESRAATTRDFGIRIKELSSKQVQNKIRTDLTQTFGDQPGLTALDFSGPLTGVMTLRQGAEETDVIERLAAAGYKETDLLKLLAIDAPSQRYEVAWKGLEQEGEEPKKGPPEKDPKAADLRKPLLHQLMRTGAVVVREVKISFGDDIKQPEDKVTERGPATADFELSATLNQPVDVRLLRDEVTKVNDKVRVYPANTERERDRGRRFVLMGERAALKQIQDSGLKTMKAPAALFKEKHLLGLTLGSPVGEAALAATLATVCEQMQLPMGAVRRIVPLGVQVKRFDVTFAELRGEKVQEKIRTDILAAFQGKFRREKIKATFSAIEEPTVPEPSKGKAATTTAAADTDEEPTAPQEPIVRLAFDRPVPLWKIERVLNEAGCPGALVGAYERGDYQEVRVKEASVAGEAVRNKIAASLESTDPFRRVVSIGGAVAGEMKNRAILAMIFAMFAIVLYVWMRFGELKFGIAAVIALAHDVLFAIGAVSVAGWLGGTPFGAWAIGDIKINLPLVAAFLTIVGYSLNDTIVIFVRIRENMGAHKRGINEEMLDSSINQTLSRTLLTSLTTLAVVLALYFLGGGVIHGFAFALTIGVIVGTYSSVFIASPVLLEWERVAATIKLLFLPIRLPFILLRLALGKRS